MDNSPYSILQQEAKIELDLEHWFEGSHLVGGNELLSERRTDGLYEARFYIYRRTTRTPLFVGFYICNGNIFLAKNDRPEDLGCDTNHNDPGLRNSYLLVENINQRVYQKLLDGDKNFREALVGKLAEFFFPH